MPTTREIRNGAVAASEIVDFEIKETGMIVVSNVNNGSNPFSLDLLTLRRVQTGDDDYAALTPAIPFNNDNNYQVLTSGFYALRAGSAGDLIITVTE